MKARTEQEQEARQKKAYENRDCIRPGEEIRLKCSGADSHTVRFRLPTCELVTCQEPGKALKKGDSVRLKCKSVATGENGYGPFVDYVFTVRETGHSVIINGPDAQSLAEKKVAPAVIHNRDIPVLADVLSMMQTVNQIERRRDWQRDRLTHITQSLTGMPGGGGEPKGLDHAFSILDELDREQEKECRGYARQLKKAQKIINGIESQSMRAFVTMKYVMGCTAKEIRQELNMTDWGYRRASLSVENAPCMGLVKWQEKYILIQPETIQTETERF